MLSSKCCFYCKYYYHINPDDDGCKLHDKIVFYDTPACSDFITVTGEDLIKPFNYNF